MISKWAKRFYQMAELVASWSKDPSTQVGAVITKQKPYRFCWLQRISTRSFR